MTQQEQLTKMIERAIEQGWEPAGYKPSSVQHDSDDAVVMFFEPKGDRPSFAHVVNNHPDLLFGDNLSFIKALVGESYQQDFQSVLSFTPYQWAAQHLVLLSDSERIPWLYEMVFSNK